MKEFKTQANNADVKIHIASFQEAMALKNSIQKAFAESGVKIKTEDNLEDILLLIMSLDSNEQVNKEVFKCLARCTYNNQRIVMDIFEDEKTREDYYEIIFACLEVNLKPFIKALFSKLKDLQTLIPKTQE
jgi:hypothetical protein